MWHNILVTRVLALPEKKIIDFINILINKNPLTFFVYRNHSTAFGERSRRFNDPQIEPQLLQRIVHLNTLVLPHETVVDVDGDHLIRPQRLVK